MKTEHKTKITARRLSPFALPTLLLSLLLSTACSDSSEPTDDDTDPVQEENVDLDPEVVDEEPEPGEEPGKVGLDGGSKDGGSKIDAGKKSDAATPAGDGGKTTPTPTVDGGTVTVIPDLDAGAETDSGELEEDASTAEPDAGEVDAGRADAGRVVDAGKPDAGPVDRVDPGKGNGSDVITIGDSWMSNTLQLTGTGGGIAPSLRTVSGQRYRNYAVQGVMLLSTSLFGPAIPTQWDDAVRENRNIKTVLMTAGGNDIIQDASLERDCQEGGPECEAVLVEIGETLAGLWKKMSDAGVQDIIHVAYAKSAGDGLKNAEANAARLQKLCDDVALPTRCHIIATDTLVNADLVLDGIHPTRAANDRIAAYLYKFMEDEKIRR